MLTRPDAAHLESIRSQTQAALSAAVGRGRDVAILDAPNQRNVGDSLIWAGEIAYLNRLGAHIRYVSDLNGFDPGELRRRLPLDGVVLLHGGGNFGDLWLGHQEHRERVIQELHDYPVVQLPQSVYFKDPRRAADANRLLRMHPRLQILIRDSLSMQRAREQLPDLPITFCPDMALGWNPSPVEAGSSPPSGVLVIARADRESASGLQHLDSGIFAPRQVRVTDWGAHAPDTAGWRIARGAAAANHTIIRARRKLRSSIPRMPQGLVQRTIHAINDINVSSALSLYSGAEVVLVDRLHAHILAILLGMDHVVLDNNYRKIGSVFDDYTGDFSTARYSLDLQDACTQMIKILEE